MNPLMLTFHLAFQKDNVQKTCIGPEKLHKKVKAAKQNLGEINLPRTVTIQLPFNLSSLLSSVASIITIVDT